MPTAVPLAAPVHPSLDSTDRAGFRKRFLRNKLLVSMSNLDRASWRSICAGDFLRNKSLASLSNFDRAISAGDSRQARPAPWKQSRRKANFRRFAPISAELPALAQPFVLAVENEFPAFPPFPPAALQVLSTGGRRDARTWAKPTDCLQRRARRRLPPWLCPPLSYAGCAADHRSRLPWLPTRSASPLPTTFWRA